MSHGPAQDGLSLRHPCHPQFPLTFSPRDCWADIHQSLNNAQKFIYITGWSVWVGPAPQRWPVSPVAGLGMDSCLTHRI